MRWESCVGGGWDIGEGMEILQVKLWQFAAIDQTPGWHVHVTTLYHNDFNYFIAVNTCIYIYSFSCCEVYMKIIHI